jgi:hypothetical protein
MKRTALRTIVFRNFLLVSVLAAAWQVNAQDTKAPYPTMAPLDQYLMERNAEIAMARSAGPDSVSQDADVMVLGAHGYETAVKGKNGFVCIVERSWTAGIEDPQFWNPKLRGPLCLNPAAARTYLPLTFLKTKSVLAGRSKDQMAEDIKTAFDKKELPELEPGAMCYMLSKQQYLNDRAEHWHPHVMFFVPFTEAAVWGANQKDSPMIASEVPLDRLTIFMITVGKWSDGTGDSH